MKLLYILFSIVVLLSSVVFAQVNENNEQKNETKSYLCSEFGPNPIGHIKSQLDGCWAETDKTPKAQSYIINYGSDKELSRRERVIRSYINFRKLNSSKITIIKGGKEKEIRTQLWIVPEGAEHPNISKDEKADLPKAAKFEEFGQVSNGELRYFTDKFFLELANKPDARGYIINYGKTKLALNRERVLRDRINLRRIPEARIKFIRGGNKREVTTELWIVPEGAEPPTP